jgi:hypothetical protein
LKLFIKIRKISNFNGKGDLAQMVEHLSLLPQLYHKL